MIPQLPEDVREHVREAFRTCNAEVAGRLSAMPTTHEEALDMALISALGRYGNAVRTPSNWLVQIQAYYEGGRRHYGRWEIADIGLLVTVLRAGQEPIRKLALLQSKRLYPEETTVTMPQRPGIYQILRPAIDPEVMESFEVPRSFTITEASQYQMLEKGSTQYRSIESYEADTQVPIYYNLYNPMDLPAAALIPSPAGADPQPSAKIVVGTRVVPAQHVRELMRDSDDGRRPSFAQLRDHLGEPFDRTGNAAGWALEHFVVDVVLRCDAGYLQRGRDDVSFARAVSLRGAPISSVIAITFVGPEVGARG